jgi:transposase
MRDTELYRHLLGLVVPWEVRRVVLSVDGGRVDVWAEHPKRTRSTCPECDLELPVYDHGEERSWRHLDSCAFLTYLHARPPRVECPTHGVRQLALPWAEPMSRFTVLFERLAIAMDMWDPYVTSTRQHLEDADDKIVFDRYHLMAYLTKAVDTVRKQQNRALVATGDKSLSGTKYLWLYSQENLPDRHKDRFGVLRGGDLLTARAWAIKESMRHFWSYKRRGWGEKHFKRWYFWATHSRLQPVIDAAKSLKRHETGLLSYFAHRVTNAGAEGINSRIQAIRVAGRGYRNRRNFKTAIWFGCGSSGVTSRCTWDDPVHVARLVYPPSFLGEVELPVLLEVAVRSQGAELEHRLGALQAPAGARQIHPVAYEVPAGALDDASGDRPTGPERFRVVEVGALVVR